MASHYDAAIIGTGQAGPSLANRLTQAGMKVAVLEQDRFGGTCVNNGCIPTKTLVASAYAAHIIARAAAPRWRRGTNAANAAAPSTLPHLHWDSSATRRNSGSGIASARARRRRRSRHTFGNTPSQ